VVSKFVLYLPTVILEISMPKVVDDSTIVGNTLLEWSVAEYERHMRPVAWYVIMTIVGCFLVGYAIFTDNFMFAIIVVLFSIILFLQSHQSPIVVPFRITELGIIINNRLYIYSELKDFFIIYKPPEIKMLFIETNSTMRPRLRVPLMDVNPNDVRELLLEFLEENLQKEEEPFSDMVARQWRIH
jgi:hypothetical protein